MAATPAFRPRPPVPPTTPPSSPPIRFCHPAYNPRRNILLQLPRVDDNGAGSPMGVHHATALLACQIVSDNAFQGRLYTDQQGQNAVQIGADEILIEDEYYFLADPNEPDLKYPIVPTFRDWTFPHGKVPANWVSITPPVMASARPKCCISDYEIGLKSAHIVPREEQPWFNTQRMDRTPSFKDINDTTNLLALRADIHHSYDAKIFAVVPKTGRSGEVTYVAHFLGEDREREVWSLYHNVPLNYASHTTPQVHLARFAWAIFPKIKPFLLERCPRLLIRDDDVGQGRQAEDVPGAELVDRYGGGGSRSANLLHPMKRRLQVDGAGDDSDDEYRDGDVFARLVAPSPEYDYE